MSLTATDWRQARFPRESVPIGAHNAMAQTLRCRPDNLFSLAPFVPMQVDGRWHIAACYDGIDGEPLLIDAKTGQMSFGEDASAVGFWGNPCIYGERLKVYSNGITFARDWVMARQETLARHKALGTLPDEQLRYGGIPGLAMIGAPEKIGNFADLQGVRTVEIDNPRLRHLLADAMLRAARLPVVVSAPPQLRVVG